MLERLGKWCRRRPTAAALILVSAVAIVTLGGVGLWSNARLRREAERADARSRLARSVVDDMYTRFAEEWLADEPHQDHVRQEFLEKAQRLYQEFAQEQRDDPAIRRETALAFFRLGQIYRTLNQHAEAQQAYDDAIALQEDLHRREPGELTYRQDLGNSHNWYGELFREKGRDLNKAEWHYEQARKLQVGLIADDGAEPAYRLELCAEPLQPRHHAHGSGPCGRSSSQPGSGHRPLDSPASRRPLGRGASP